MATAGAQKGTIVRAKARLGAVGLRTTFAALEGIAPAVGARRAAALWCTVPAGRARRRDERPRTRSTTRVLSTQHGWRVVVESWKGHGEQRRDPVYLVHGWGGWRGQLGGFVEPLLATGHDVVAFDAPGHGGSGPGSFGHGRSTLPELAEALVAVVRTFGSPAAIVAHSLGCAATALAIGDGLRVPAVVFIAPTADPLARLDEFAQALGLGRRTKLALGRRLERLSHRPLSDFYVPDIVRHAGAVSALVLHDEDDKEVSPTEARNVAEAWPGAVLVATAGLGHQRILRDASITQQASSFVRSAAESPARS